MNLYIRCNILFRYYTAAVRCLTERYNVIIYLFNFLSKKNFVIQEAISQHTSFVRLMFILVVWIRSGCIICFLLRIPRGLRVIGDRTAALLVVFVSRFVVLLAFCYYDVLHCIGYSTQFAYRCIVFGHEVVVYCQCMFYAEAYNDGFVFPLKKLGSRHLCILFFMVFSFAFFFFPVVMPLLFLDILLF